MYQLDSYRYWQDQLRRDDFTYGQFGENFTVDGLADDEVCVGDRYRIGSALFEVTQPRVTCYRVGIRMDEPRMLRSSSRTAVRASTSACSKRARSGRATIMKIATGPEAMTVADVNALLYLPEHPTSELTPAPCASRL